MKVSQVLHVSKTALKALTIDRVLNLLPPDIAPL